MFNFLRRDPEPQILGYVHDDVFGDDPRALQWVQPFGGGTLPKSFSLSDDGWTLNQGHTSSCTAHGLVHAIGMMTGKRLSPRYSFHTIKTDSDYRSSRIDWGAYTVDNMKLLQKEGICDYGLAPNRGNSSDEKYINLKVTDEMKRSAKKNKGGVYVKLKASYGSQLDRFDVIKRYLATEKRPCLVGMNWHREYNSRYNPTGIIPTENYKSRSSGHIVTAMGYTKHNNHEYLICENSFGANWGKSGQVWLPKGFAVIQSAIAFLPENRSNEIGYEIPTSPVDDRDRRREKLVWEDFEKLVIERWFPLDVAEGSKQANMVARSMMEREKLKIIFALAYLGWAPYDLKHHYYARSRGKEDKKSYHLDITKTRKDQLGR